MTRLLLRHRRLISEAVHGALAALALVFSFLLRFEFTLDAVHRHMLLESLPILVGVKLAVFRAFALRDLAWRYLGFADLVRLASSNAAASAAATIALRLAIGNSFPRSIHVLDLLTCLILMVGARGAVRIAFEVSRKRPREDTMRRILIYGAGKAGVRVLSEIAANPQIGYRVLGFLDDDPGKRDLRIHGVRVLGGGEDLPAIARKRRVAEVLVALPTASGNQITTILEKCHAAPVAAKRIPALWELIEHRVLVDQIREVRLEDLLGRPPVRLEEDQILERLAGTVVLVTGAGGSIGSELCRQIARYRPAALIGFDHAETSLYEIDREIREKFQDVIFHPEIGNIRSRERLDQVFRDYRPKSVYHAAAYKHVPMMEQNLFEAVENNVLGTSNVAQAAIHGEAEDFVLISSDKAVRPANVMGATKRLAELVCLAASSPGARARFMAVRFGNVLGSSGSVIPLFKRQIAGGGPVTVTHPRMSRYFMMTAEAAQLVLQAAAMGRGGEIFVLEMGTPVLIADLARKMVLLSGLKPGVDIRIVYSGSRPGEKLSEELSAFEEDTLPTPHTQIRIFEGRGAARETMARCLEDLRRYSEARDAGNIVLCFKDLIPDYNPSRPVLEQALRQAMNAQTVLA